MEWNLLLFSTFGAFLVFSLKNFCQTAVSEVTIHTQDGSIKSSEMKSKEKKRDRTKCTPVTLKALKLPNFIFTAQYQIKN